MKVFLFQINLNGNVNEYFNICMNSDTREEVIKNTPYYHHIFNINEIMVDDMIGYYDFMTDNKILLKALESES